MGPLDGAVSSGVRQMAVPQRHIAHIATGILGYIVDKKRYRCVSDSVLSRWTDMQHERLGTHRDFLHPRRNFGIDFSMSSFNDYLHGRSNESFLLFNYEQFLRGESNFCIIGRPIVDNRLKGKFGNRYSS